MHEEIYAVLDALKLRHARATVAEALRLAQKDKPSYSSFLLELLRREHEGQRNRALAARLKHSGLRDFWALDTFPFHLQKCVNKRAIYELAELDFIERGESVIFIGPAASGKSGLASAILLKAIYAGKRALAMTAQKLFDEFTASRADRSTQKLMCRLERLDLFLIEEFGYLNTVDPRQVNDFFQLMDIRCNRKSTMLTTNLGYEEWGKFLGNDSLVAALISRLGQKSRTFAFPKDAVNLRNPKLSLPATALRPAILDAV